MFMTYYNFLRKGVQNISVSNLKFRYYLMQPNRKAIMVHLKQLVHIYCLFFGSFRPTHLIKLYGLYKILCGHNANYFDNFKNQIQIFLRDFFTCKRSCSSCMKNKTLEHSAEIQSFIFHVDSQLTYFVIIFISEPTPQKYVYHQQN